MEDVKDPSQVLIGCNFLGGLLSQSFNKIWVSKFQSLSLTPNEVEESAEKLNCFLRDYSI